MTAPRRLRREALCAATVTHAQTPLHHPLKWRPGRTDDNDIKQVLKNPSVPFQEGRSVDLATLASRGVAPYGPPVDVWAAGVLAYELVAGRPPFEVEDEAQTAALIMYSDGVKFPAGK